MARKSNREPCSDDEEWTTITDAQERRRIQNRNNQRAFRRRRAAEREVVDSRIGQSRRRTQPVLLPKLASGSSSQGSTTHESRDPMQESLTVWRSSNMPSPSSARFHDMTGVMLDLQAQRVFRYASQSLQTCFDWEVDGGHESIAAALVRLSLQEPLVLHSFLWTAANELNVQAPDVENALVMHRSQNMAIGMIRQNIQKNNITDALIFAVYALASSETSAVLAEGDERLDSQALMMDSTIANHPLASAGWEAATDHTTERNMHAQAAAELLQRKGGLRSMTAPGLAEQMQAVDLLRSLQGGTKPLFGLCRSFQGVLETEMAEYRQKEVLTCAVPDSFRDMFLDLRCYAKQIQLYARSGSPPAVRPQQLVIWRNVNQHRLLSWRDSGDRVCRLTSLALSYLVFLPVCDAQTIERIVDELIAALVESVAEGEVMHVWSISVAVVAAWKREQRQNLERLAKELHRQLELDGWEEDVRPILYSHIWIDDTFEEEMELFWTQVCTSTTS